MLLNPLEIWRLLRGQRRDERESDAPDLEPLEPDAIDALWIDEGGEGG